MTFAQFLAPICSLDEFMLVAVSQSQSADFAHCSWQVSQKIWVFDGLRFWLFLASDYDSIQLDDIKAVWYFELF